MMHFFKNALGQEIHAILPIGNHATEVGVAMVRLPEPPQRHAGQETAGASVNVRVGGKPQRDPDLR
jgi:hypothetical protein